MKSTPSKEGPRVERVTSPAGREPASGLDHFFSAVAARHDRWRELIRAAQAWAARGAGAAQKAECARKLEALRPFASGFRYVNYLADDDGADLVNAAYATNAGRLAQVKRAYDPDNVFHVNLNIAPA